MGKHLSLNYLEIPTPNLAKTKTFFETVFGWQFIDYGEHYSCFTGQPIDGGFYQHDKSVNCEVGAPLIVLYSENLEDTQENIALNGGSIVRPIFSFPGGRRFHFHDTAGNEYAVWSE